MSAIASIREKVQRRSTALAARLRGLLFPYRVRHVAGPRDVASSDTTLVVVCLVRDGGAYLDDFVAHYRELGAAHIVFLDNGSSDGTRERAARLDGVTVLSTSAPYRDYARIAKRYLIGRYGTSGWVLCVDIDELFDYPYRDRVPLPAFLRYLRQHRFNAVVGHLLDLFPSGPLLETDAPRGEHRYYDISGIEREPYDRAHGNGNHAADPSLSVYSGGIRATAFGARVNLTKHPLVYPPDGPVFVTSHRVLGAHVADVTTVLLHYKYVGAFYEHAHRVVRERSYYQDSAEYRRYLDALGQKPRLRLLSETSRELVGVDQLIDEGFLTVSDAYRRLAYER